MKRPSLCLVTAAPVTLQAFMQHHLRRLVERYDVTTVSSFNPDELAAPGVPGVRRVPLSIARPIRPASDLRALAALVRFFRRERFDLVQSVTPKAGLLAMTAAAVCRVPRRVHWFTGQVWATRHGAARRLLKGADRWTARRATHLLADSHSQRDFLEQELVVRPGQVQVLGSGSIAGVDLERFRPDRQLRDSWREAHHIPREALLILYLGRLNRDKGVLDLAEAFAQAARQDQRLWLALVGHDEAGLQKEVLRRCGAAQSRVCRVPFTPAPERWMAAADWLALPSYREGFGSVVIEAAACGIPAVASRIYGLTDAVHDAATGLLHPPGDVAALAACLLRLAGDEALRQRLGEQARDRAVREFPQEQITASLLDWYASLGV